MDPEDMSADDARAYIIDDAFRITESVPREYLKPFEDAVHTVVKDARGKKLIARHQLTALETADAQRRMAGWARRAVSSITGGLVSAELRPRTPQEERQYQKSLAAIEQLERESDILPFVEELLRAQSTDNKGIAAAYTHPQILRPGQDAIITGTPLLRLQYKQPDGTQHSLRLRIDEKSGRNRRDYYHTLSAEDSDSKEGWRVLGEPRGVRVSNNNSQSFMEIRNGSVRGNPPAEDGTVENIVRLKFEKNGDFLEGIDDHPFTEDASLAALHCSVFLFLDAAGDPRYVLRMHGDTPAHMTLTFEGEEKAQFRVMRPSAKEER